ncbi:MAG: hypothetical protein JXB32_03605 [Deltaproteobacteria bacterium]|nr:hypothetical protein [Deltaproteobacteria bacterium]
MRPASDRPAAPRLALVALLAAAATACGASAGAPCESSDDCAAGMTCRGGVCLPLVPEDADAAEPDDAAGDDGEPPDGEDDGAGDEGTEVPADDGGTDDAADVPPPPLGTPGPGEVYDPPDPTASGVLGATGETYVLLLWDNGLGVWDSWDVEVLAENGRKSVEPRVVDPGTLPTRAAIPCLPGRFVDLEARRLPDAPFPVLRDPLPGDTATFRVINAAGTAMEEVTARLEYLGPDLEIWADQTNPFTSPGAEVYEGIAGQFEGTILPRERVLFHEEPDVDGNGRVTLLVSPTVGEIGASGYVNPYDLTTSSYGNHKDMIYLNPPGGWGGPEYQILAAAGVLAHELQHLIRAGALGIDPIESIYLNEGMSHLAADLAGYGFDNLWFLTEFLEDYEPFTVPRGIDSARMAASSDWHEDVVMRSAGYFLLRYLFDRLGGVTYAADGSVTDAGGMSLLRSQFTGERFGIAALEWATGASRRDFLPDWLTAMLLDGRTDAGGTPLPLPPRHRFADPGVDPLTGAQLGIALNAENAYLDWGSVRLDNVAPTDLRDFSGHLDAGGVALLMVRPVADGPVVVRLVVERGADLGARWVRLE